MPDIEHQTPIILSRITAAAESDANRMIVGIQGKGNLKVALQQEFTSIGREPGNDLQIKSRFVSRYHARIVNNDEGAIIEDLDSMNGICVNTEKTRRRQLRSGDFIKIGRVHLQYIDITESTFCGNAS
jgi:pSer/pThr/pTyr-binding forkhead associated (FHA) protein